MDKEFTSLQKKILAAQSTNNRQGRGNVWKVNKRKVLELLKNDAEELIIIMKICLMKDLMAQKLMRIKNLAKELARMNLTLNTYTISVEN